MYRLGEACSHLAALLSCVVEASVARQMSGRDCCTAKKCLWLQPATSVSTIYNAIATSNFVIFVVLYR